jgi:hypothetical protein
MEKEILKRLGRVHSHLYDARQVRGYRRKITKGRGRGMNEDSVLSEIVRCIFVNARVSR